MGLLARVPAVLFPTSHIYCFLAEGHKARRSNVLLPRSHLFKFKLHQVVLCGGHTKRDLFHSWKDNGMTQQSGIRLSLLSLSMLIPYFVVLSWAGISLKDRCWLFQKMLAYSEIEIYHLIIKLAWILCFYLKVEAGAYIRDDVYMYMYEYACVYLSSKVSNLTSA